MGAIRRFLDLNRGHLPRTDRDRIARTIKAGEPAACMAGTGSWLVYVPDEPIAPGRGATDALRAILDRARAAGCDYVLFDHDGPIDETFTWFEE
jgi:hypothetical protein